MPAIPAQAAVEDGIIYRFDSDPWGGGKFTALSAGSLRFVSMGVATRASHTGSDPYDQLIGVTADGDAYTASMNFNTQAVSSWTQVCPGTKYVKAVDVYQPVTLTHSGMLIDENGGLTDIQTGNTTCTQINMGATDGASFKAKSVRATESYLYALSDTGEAYVKTYGTLTQPTWQRIHTADDVKAIDIIPGSSTSATLIGEDNKLRQADLKGAPATTPEEPKTDGGTSVKAMRIKDIATVQTLMMDKDGNLWWNNQNSLTDWTTTHGAKKLSNLPSTISDFAPSLNSIVYGRDSFYALTGTPEWLQQHTLTFDLNGAPGQAPNSQTLDTDGKTVRPTDPTWVGHRFLGWFSTAADGTEFTFGSTLTTDTTVYAQWEVSSASAMPQTGATTNVLPQAAPYCLAAFGILIAMGVTEFRARKIR